MPMSDYDFELARRRFFRDPITARHALVDRPMTFARPSFTRQLSEGRSDVSDLQKRRDIRVMTSSLRDRFRLQMEFSRLLWMLKILIQKTSR